MTASLRLTYIGGPTALIEFRGHRLLTDPTLDPGGTDYPTPAYTLHKTQGPAVSPEALGRIDAVLLSHDHHFDNLDHAGRACLAAAPIVLTTVTSAARLGGSAWGLEPWEAVPLPPGGPAALTISATPARHGPAGGDRGPVIGFVIQPAEPEGPAVYVSGDTVWYDQVAEIGHRVPVRIALLNLGAARVAVAGPSPLTFTATEAVELAEAWPDATIVPLHFEGWAHFSEGRAEIAHAFESAGLTNRLRWLEPGRPTSVRL